MRLSVATKAILIQIFACLTVISLITLTCTSIEKNQEYIQHVQFMDKLYKQTSNSVYPNQNFVYMMQSLITKVDGEDVAQLLSTASGIAVKNDGNTIYALTAGHWCSANPEFLDEEFLQKYAPWPSKIQMQVAFYGKVYNVEVVHSDIINDICVVSFDSEFAKKIKKIKPAKKYPKLGEKLYTVSAPLGMYHPYTRFHFEGYFSGCIDSHVYCFYTIPGIEGSSGSGVLNKDGRLVSILDISVVDFYQITGGAKLEIIKEVFIIYIP
jgi:hypothetical protein